MSSCDCAIKPSGPYDPHQCSTFTGCTPCYPVHPSVTQPKDCASTCKQRLECNNMLGEGKGFTQKICETQCNAALAAPHNPAHRVWNCLANQPPAATKDQCQAMDKQCLLQM